MFTNISNKISNIYKSVWNVFNNEGNHNHIQNQEDTIKIDNITFDTRPIKTINKHPHINIKNQFERIYTKQYMMKSKGYQQSIKHYLSFSSAQLKEMLEKGYREKDKQQVQKLKLQMIKLNHLVLVQRCQQEEFKLNCEKIMKNLKDFQTKEEQLNRIANFNCSKQKQILDIQHQQTRKLKIFQSISRIQFPNLKTLNLSGNDLISIQSLTFMDIPNIQQINLQYNKLRTINCLSKTSYGKLQKLMIASNSICNGNQVVRGNFKQLKSSLVDDKIYRIRGKDNIQNELIQDADFIFKMLHLQNIIQIKVCHENRLLNEARMFLMKRKLGQRLCLIFSIKPIKILRVDKKEEKLLIKIQIKALKLKIFDQLNFITQQQANQINNCSFLINLSN